MAEHHGPNHQRKFYPQPQSNDGHTGMGFSTMKHYEEVKARMLRYAHKQDEFDYDHYYGHDRSYNHDHDYDYDYYEEYYVQTMLDGKRREAARAKPAPAPSPFLAVPQRHDLHPRPGQGGMSPGNIRRNRSPMPVSPSPNRKRDKSKKR